MIKVTHRDAIAFEEVKANPFCVLCTTSTGGHIGWFELGGGRWYVKPTTGFLREFQQNIDFEETRLSSKETAKRELASGAGGARYMSMRRRLVYQGDQQ